MKKHHPHDRAERRRLKTLRDLPRRKENDAEVPNEPQA